jgi:hypothetical protein
MRTFSPLHTLLFPDMSNPREEETPIENWLRCNRFYSIKGEWFFSTREGIDHGPFPSREEAMAELQKIIDASQAKPLR